MGVSITFMFLGLLVGVFRLMSLNFLATAIFAGLYGLHSIIMVFGFLAAIIMTERVAGVRMIPGAESFKAPRVMVPLIMLGVVGEMIGYSWQLPIVRYLGALLLVAGCLAFIVTLKFLRKKTEAKPPFDFMTLSVAALMLAAVDSAFTLPVDDMGFIMLLISFPVLFILGERVELTWIISGVKGNTRFKRTILVAAMSIVLFAIGSTARFTTLGDLTFLIGSLLLLMVLISVLITENQNLKVLLNSPRPLQRYVSQHVRVAYVWAVIGLVLAIIYSLSGLGWNLYDPFIHSLTVGFIGTMMLAHAPVILPGILKKNFNEEKLTTLPLGVLTLAVALRMGGDISSSLFYDVNVGLVISFSGWLVLAVVLLFLNSIKTGIIEPTSHLHQTPIAEHQP